MNIDKPKMCGICLRVFTQEDHGEDTRYICISCVKEIQDYNIEFYDLIRGKLVCDYTGWHHLYPKGFRGTSDKLWSFDNWQEHPLVRHLRNDILLNKGTNKSSDWNTICNMCSSPAYIGLNKVECSNTQCKGETK